MASSTNPTILVVYLPNETLLVSTAETTSNATHPAKAKRVKPLYHFRVDTRDDGRLAAVLDGIVPIQMPTQKMNDAAR